MDNIKTVADKIRSMNDEELALFIAQNCFVSYKNGYKHALHRKQIGVKITFDMMLNAHKQMLSGSAEKTDFGPLPGMGS